MIRSASNWTDPDALRHRETLGVAMAWKRRRPVDLRFRGTQVSARGRNRAGFGRMRDDALDGMASPWGSWQATDALLVQLRRRARRLRWESLYLQLIYRWQPEHTANLRHGLRKETVLPFARRYTAQDTDL